MSDPFAVLGVSHEATPAEIKSAFRRLSQAHHPDRNPDNQEAAGLFRKVTEAYRLLSDPVKRQEILTGQRATVTDKPHEVVLAWVQRDFATIQGGGAG